MYKYSLFFLALISLASVAFAGVNQTDICTSQCAAYRLAWRQNQAYVFITQWCSYGKGDLFLDIVGAWASYATRDPDFMTVMKSLQCAHDINAYIKPIFDSCRRECMKDPLFFGPDLVVASDTVSYIQENKRLYVRVINTGFAYVDSADVYIYAGYDDKINLDPPNMRLVHRQKLTCITPYDPRFVPNSSCWYEKSFSIPWEHEKDMFNVVRVVVSISQPPVAEYETDYNTYNLIIDDLPEPPFVRFDGPTIIKRNAPSTASFTLVTNITNRGELPAGYYIYYYKGNERYFFDQFDIGPNQTITFNQGITFTSPYPDYIRMEIRDQDNNPVDYRYVYPNPQFLIVAGRVVDEDGNPVSGATVYVDNHRSPVITGDDGYYSFLKTRFFTQEGTYRLTAHKDGYADNSTTVTFKYNSTDSLFLHDRYVYIDFVLPEQQKTLYVGYPSRGWYNILTDKGQYRGEYGAIPQGGSGAGAEGAISAALKGSNGTLVITSQNCTILITNFSFGAISNFTQGQSATERKIPVQDVRCLRPDTVDDYQLLRGPQLLWEKPFQGEVPHIVTFSKNGKYAYVLAVNNSDLFCRIYAYNLKTGDMVYSYKTNSMCRGKQASALIPAYDGSRLYAGIAANKRAKRGEKVSKGYLFGESGNIIETWDWPDYAETLADSSATELLDVISSSGKFYAPGHGYISECLLSAYDDCEGTNHRTVIRKLGVPRNRAVGECNGFGCLFALNSPDYTLIKHPIDVGENTGITYNGENVAGDYAGSNSFMLWKYNRLEYYENAVEYTFKEKDVNMVAVSPGGKYTIISYEPKGIEVYVDRHTLANIANISQAIPNGIGATETGLYYSEYKGGKLRVYALSSIVEPQSTTQSLGTTGQRTGFIEQVIGFVASAANYLIDLVKWLFGIK
ncbi:MAG: carboxypeptidase regulatory-like domain-containing protein [Candidatus Micrarchaeota archaeon]|nr:carboxypeptidase regulatory-like domain-containing protein [Candidatus Micrarchaeota archaeon]